MSISRRVRLLVGGSLLLGLLWLVDPARVAAALQAMHWGWLALTAAALTVSTLIGAMNLHLLFDPAQRLKLVDFLPVYWTGWAIGLIVPGQVGDVGSMAVLLRRHSFDWHQSLGPMLLDKLVSLCVMGALGAIGVGIALPVAPVVAIGTLGLFVLAAFAAAGWLARRAPPAASATDLVSVLKRSLHEVMATVRRRPRHVALNVVLTGVKTAVMACAYWATFRALEQPDADYPRVASVMAACALVAYVPISLNGVGTVEAAAIVLFGAIGIPAPSVLAGYLLLRTLVFALAWLPVLAGFAFARPKPDNHAP